MENSMEVSKKLKVELPYDPAIPLLGIDLKEMKSLSWRDICTPHVTAAFFIIAKTWKKLVSTNGRIGKEVTYIEKGILCVYVYMYVNIYMNIYKYTQIYMNIYEYMWIYIYRSIIQL